jgi:hypothetical protein
LPPPSVVWYLQPFAINHNAALKTGYKVPIEEEGEERRYRHDDADGHHRRVELGVHIAHKAGQHVEIRKSLDLTISSDDGLKTRLKTVYRRLNPSTGHWPPNSEKSLF